MRIIVVAAVAFLGGSLFGWICCAVFSANITDEVWEIMMDEQPTIKPVIIPCDYAKACNEATMNKVTSAVAYYAALEELRKHGYVLVDLREATDWPIVREVTE